MDIEEIKALAQRHLKACETIYDTANQRGDSDTAAHAARSALSVALNCAIDLGHQPSRELVFIWHERLFALCAETAPGSKYLNKAIKWATGATRSIVETEVNQVQ